MSLLGENALCMIRVLGGLALSARQVFHGLRLYLWLPKEKNRGSRRSASGVLKHKTCVIVAPYNPSPKSSDQIARAGLCSHDYVAFWAAYDAVFSRKKRVVSFFLFLWEKTL